MTYCEPRTGQDFLYVTAEGWNTHLDHTHTRARTQNDHTVTGSQTITRLRGSAIHSVRSQW